MNEAQCILIADDDDAVTTGLSMMLSRRGRTTIVCSDVEAAEVALGRFPVTHVLTDVQFTGEFGFEGLHFVSRIHSQRLDCRVIVMTGEATDSLRREARRYGAASVLSKPFELAELELALEGGPRPDESSAQVEAPEYRTFCIPPIEEVLTNGTLTTAFQPIARLTESGAARFGFEALTRVRSDWLCGGPALLFAYAERRGRLARLNVTTLNSAIHAAAPLPDDSTVFINVDPLVFDGGELVPLLKACRTGVDLGRVVLEITERSAFADDGVAARVFDELREAGVRFALDDHGSAYSHLSLIDRIRPSFIKVSQAFGTSFEKDPSKEKIIRHVVALARDFGCETILEGVETAATARAAAAVGITLAQGFYFGRPRSASHWLRRSNRAGSTGSQRTDDGSLVPNAGSADRPTETVTTLSVGA